MNRIVHRSIFLLAQSPQEPPRPLAAWMSEPPLPPDACRLPRSLALHLLSFLPVQDLTAVAALRRNAVALAHEAMRQATAVHLCDWPGWEMLPRGYLLHTLALKVRSLCRSVRQLVIEGPEQREVAWVAPIADLLRALAAGGGDGDGDSGGLERLVVSGSSYAASDLIDGLGRNLRHLEVPGMVHLNAQDTHRLLKTAPHLHTLIIASCDPPALCAAFPRHSLRCLRLERTTQFLPCHLDALLLAVAGGLLEELGLQLSAEAWSTHDVDRLFRQLDDTAGVLPHLERLAVLCVRPVRLRTGGQRRVAPVALRRLRALTLRGVHLEDLLTGSRLEELRLLACVCPRYNTNLSARRRGAERNFSALPSRNPALTALRLDCTAPETSLAWLHRWHRHLRHQRAAAVGGWSARLRTVHLRFWGGDERPTAPCRPPRRLLVEHVLELLEKLSALRDLHLDLSAIALLRAGTLVRLLDRLPALEALAVVYSTVAPDPAAEGLPREHALRKLHLQRTRTRPPPECAHPELLATLLPQVHLPHVEEVRMCWLPDEVDLTPFLWRASRTLTLLQVDRCPWVHVPSASAPASTGAAERPRPPLPRSTRIRRHPLTERPLGGPCVLL